MLDIFSKLIKEQGKDHWLKWTITLILILLFFFGEQILLNLFELFTMIFHINEYISFFVDIILLIILLIIVLKFNKYSQHNIAIGLPQNIKISKYFKITLIRIIQILFLYALYAFIVMIFNVQFSSTLNQQSINNTAENSNISLIWILILSIIIAPVIEETVFRLLLIGPIQTIRHKYGDISYHKHRLYMAWISFFLFILVHLIVQIITTNYHSNLQIRSLIMGFVSYLILSIVITNDYYHYGDVRRTIGIHIAWNLISSLSFL
ncbi:hypothetical protein WR164_14910 [Philodulcilactobacillus myokoensis]|uniref:CAAX prenyl protease 2/Lysostaphin resistance protein A-like domain-containing protein n=1 Tax=Philodulcilactobacillus myokoensis TaxID=2929573 RepID=A0A9W6ETN0_9LACO|nr:CPBP family glutamic-type intramembrane protease [Philodulcilactobacillus myokoensis]GLB47512.1 hypothetical protein WR164_14910 [Philodulcilactobacillus myokoensis]